jgi:hypothetical protein
VIAHDAAAAQIPEPVHDRVGARPQIGNITQADNLINSLTLNVGQDSFQGDVITVDIRE